MANFDNIPEQAQKDLLEWLNISEPNTTDKRRLTALYFAGLFHAWNCINCAERCYFGEPEDWGNFQGVRQLDFTSYPGGDSSPSRRVKMCDHCRMYDVKSDEELDLTGTGQPRIWESEEEYS